jgi:hypothetical protein
MTTTRFLPQQINDSISGFNHPKTISLPKTGKMREPNIRPIIYIVTQKFPMPKASIPIMKTNIATGLKNLKKDIFYKKNPDPLDSKHDCYYLNH